MAAGDIFREDEVGLGGQQAIVEITTTSGRKAYAIAALTAGGGGGGGGAATVADGADTAQGSTTSPAYADTTGAAAGTIVGLLKGAYALLAARLPTLGQKTAANSQSVVLASDQGVVTTGGAGAAGAAPTGNPNLIAGSDGTVARIMQTNPSGAVYVYGSGGGNFPVAGIVASGAADSGNPIKIGGFASTSAPTAVTAGQRVNAWYNLNGACVTQLVAANGNAYTSSGPSDGLSNSTTGLGVLPYNLTFNGTTWDRQRKANVFTRLAATAATGSPTSVKTTAGDARKAWGQNGAAITYLQLYSKASAPVIGTDTPTLTYPIPANAAFSTDFDCYFPAGVAIAFTTDAAGTTAAAASAVTAFGFTAA